MEQNFLYISINLIYFAAFNIVLAISKFDNISKRVWCNTDSLELIVNIFNNQVLFVSTDSSLCVIACGLDIYMTVV